MAQDSFMCSSPASGVVQGVVLSSSPAVMKWRLAAELGSEVSEAHGGAANDDSEHNAVRSELV